MAEPADDSTEVHPVDRIRPVYSLTPFAIQHVIVMVAMPISSVFLIASALDLPEHKTPAVLSAVFVFCGIGSMLPSLGVWKIGMRLPFIVLPGGAATVLFITIGRDTDVETAVGAVILTGIFYIVAVQLFVKVLNFFPPLVMMTPTVASAGLFGRHLNPHRHHLPHWREANRFVFCRLTMKSAVSQRLSRLDGPLELPLESMARGIL